MQYFFTKCFVKIDIFCMKKSIFKEFRFAKDCRYHKNCKANALNRPDYGVSGRRMLNSQFLRDGAYAEKPVAGLRRSANRSAISLPAL